MSRQNHKNSENRRSEPSLHVFLKIISKTRVEGRGRSIWTSRMFGTAVTGPAERGKGSWELAPLPISTVS